MRAIRLASGRGAPLDEGAGATPRARAGRTAPTCGPRGRTGGPRTRPATAPGSIRPLSGEPARVAALDLLAERLAQPAVVRGREAVLGPVDDRRRQQPLHRPPVQPLAASGTHAQPRRDPLHEAHQLDVEERDALLEARRHRHLVRADEQVVRQEQVRVEVERLLEQVAAVHVGEHVRRPADAARRRPRRRRSPTAARGCARR